MLFSSVSIQLAHAAGRREEPILLQHSSHLTSLLAALPKTLHEVISSSATTIRSQFSVTAIPIVQKAIYEPPEQKRQPHSAESVFKVQILDWLYCAQPF